jgi:hypothetical protein
MENTLIKQKLNHTKKILKHLKRFKTKITKIIEIHIEKLITLGVDFEQKFNNKFNETLEKKGIKTINKNAKTYPRDPKLFFDYLFEKLKTDYQLENKDVKHLEKRMAVLIYYDYLTILLNVANKEGDIFGILTKIDENEEILKIFFGAMKIINDEPFNVKKEKIQFKSQIKNLFSTILNDSSIAVSTWFNTYDGGKTNPNTNLLQYFEPIKNDLFYFFYGYAGDDKNT